MAGWRVGFVVGNSDIIQGLRTLKTNLDYGIFSVIQKAAETALQLPDEYVKQVQERYRQRQGFFNQRFGAIRLGYSPSKATMYLWVPCSVGMTSTDFALSVLQKTGVVVTPGNAFGEGRGRLCARQFNRQYPAIRGSFTAPRRCGNSLSVRRIFPLDLPAKSL
jgi:LL-diaminopimelate aminotransferase